MIDGCERGNSMYHESGSLGHGICPESLPLSSSLCHKSVQDALPRVFYQMKMGYHKTRFEQFETARPLGSTNLE